MVYAGDQRNADDPPEIVKDPLDPGVETVVSLLVEERPATTASAIIAQFWEAPRVNPTLAPDWTAVTASYSAPPVTVFVVGAPEVTKVKPAP